MPKSFAPFIEMTRKEPTEGYSNIFLLAAEQIAAVRCLDDGGARVFVVSEPFMSQWIDPVENYAYFVDKLTELTLATDLPAPETQPAETG